MQSHRNPSSAAFRCCAQPASQPHLQLVGLVADGLPHSAHPLLLGVKVLQRGIWGMQAGDQGCNAAKPCVPSFGA